MKPQTYVRECLRTYNTAQDERTLTLGIFGEAGELVDKIKKHTFQGVHFTANEMLEKVGDCLFYVTLRNHLTPTVLKADFTCWPIKSRHKPHDLVTLAFRLMYAFERVQDGGLQTNELLCALDDIARHFGSSLRQVAYSNVQKLRWLRLQTSLFDAYQKDSDGTLP